MNLKSPLWSKVSSVNINLKKGDEFPRAIVHVDGDAFFVGCELAKRPWLKCLPVVTGEERGIVSALSYEAKALGIRRGMRMSDVRKMCPNIHIFSSDYESYLMYSQRMYRILKRYTEKVEAYSIDECFADITGLEETLKMSYEEIARSIKNDLDSELGTTFSLGLSVNKVLAKSASKWQKPSGFTMIPFFKINEYLKEIPIGKIWGVGASTSVEMSKLNIYSAYEFASKTNAWVKEHFSKPSQELHAEFNGEFIHQVNVENTDEQKSVMRTRTFRPSSKNKNYIFSELSKNIEEACRKIRSLDLSTRDVYFFIKTSEFKYYGASVKLEVNSAVPQEIIKQIKEKFEDMFVPNILYRATGVRFGSLCHPHLATLDLFGKKMKEEKINEIYKVADILSQKFGEKTIYLASSFRAREGDVNKKKRINIPMLGEVY